MKPPYTRPLALALALLLLCITLPLAAQAAGPDISAAFTDPGLLAAVLDALDKPAGSPVTAEDCAAITTLDAGSYGITSLAGIGLLSNLLVLDCSGNELAALDFSTNPLLAWLECGQNPLTSLNLTQNGNLTRLFCPQAELASLNLAQNTALDILFVPGNPKLAALNISHNTVLKELNVADCALTSLDISKNKLLEHLFCLGNRLQSLNVVNYKNLRTLDCSNNLLTSLNLTGCDNLSVLACNGNQISTLDVSGQITLYALDCGENLLSGLNVAANKFLFSLCCGGNQITSLNLSNNLLLQNLDCANNRITALDLSQNELLVTLNCAGNRLTSLDVLANTRLYSIDCAANQLTSLNITGLRELRELDVRGNAIPSKLAITGLPDIEKELYYIHFDPQAQSGTDVTARFTDPNLLAALRAAMGKHPSSPIVQEECDLVTSLDLSGWGIESLAGLECFVNLQSLNVADNNLAQLDLSILPGLKELDCSGNQLTSLDLSASPMLKKLWCSDNRLEQLNLEHNPALEVLYCSRNLLSTLWLANNPALRELNCACNLLLSLNLTQNTQLKNLDVRWNYMADEGVLLLPPSGGVSCFFYPQNALDMDVTEYFTDELFLAAIREALHKAPGEPITALDCRSITDLDVSGLGIKSLSGLVFLTNLAHLNCSDNKLAVIDVTNNLALQSIDARMNWLQSPSDVVGLRAETELLFSPQTFSGEIITDVFTDPAFRDAIRAALGKDPDDPIGSLDCALAETLDLRNSGIKNVSGIEKFTGLKALNLAGNELGALNLAQNLALETLDVSRNHLTALNLLANRNLISVNASYNFISSQSLVRLPTPAPASVIFNQQCDLTPKAATCTAGGYETWTCVHNPAHTLTVNQVPALGHLYQATVTKPTFTQGGYTTHTCSRCHDSYVDSYTDKITIPPYPPTLTLNYHQACSTFSDIARVSPDMQWKSSNEKVLKIDSKGLVTYPKLARGNTTITGTLDGVTYVTVNVTVKITFWQWLLIIFLFGWIWY